MSDSMIDKVRRRIAKIPANNPAVISMYPETLLTVLSFELLQKIAEEAVSAMREDNCSAEKPTTIAKATGG